VLKAIVAAQAAYDEAIKGGATRPDPDATLLPGEFLKPKIEQMTTPGGTPCSVASCN
jgi:hypothetical protein